MITINASAEAKFSMGDWSDDCQMELTARLVYLPDPTTGTYKNPSEEQYSFTASGGGHIASVESWTYDGRQPPSRFGGFAYYPTERKASVGTGYLSDLVTATPEAGQGSERMARTMCKMAEDDYIMKPDSGAVTLASGQMSGSGGGEGQYDFAGFGTASFRITYTIRIPTTTLEITSIETPTKSAGQYSFVASDTIQLTAQVSPARAGVPIHWKVEGLGPVAGIKGFPSFTVETDAAGSSVFSFSPSINPWFVLKRQMDWTGGSVNPNPPLAFEVTAKNDSENPVLEAKSSSKGRIEQDEMDTLRQEWFDYKAPVPDRSEFTASLGGNYNRGNYAGAQRNKELQQYYERIRGTYRGWPITVDGVPTVIPADAVVVLGVGGGFRCPRRNVAAGSKYPVTSFHTRGRALDIAPRLCAVSINGKRRQLKEAELHSVLYPALLKAAQQVVQGKGSALTEDGAEPVPAGSCGITRVIKDKKGNEKTVTLCEDHVHVQWQ